MQPWRGQTFIVDSLYSFRICVYENLHGGLRLRMVATQQMQRKQPVIIAIFKCSTGCCSASRSTASCLHHLPQSRSPTHAISAEL